MERYPSSPPRELALQLASGHQLIYRIGKYRTRSRTWDAAWPD